MADGLLAQRGRRGAGWRGEALQVIRITERHANDGDVGIERVEIIAPGRIEERRLAQGHRRDSCILRHAVHPPRSGDALPGLNVFPTLGHATGIPGSKSSAEVMSSSSAESHACRMFI